MVSEQALQQAFSKIKSELASIRSEMTELKKSLGTVSELKKEFEGVKKEIQHVETVESNPSEPLVQVKGSKDEDSYY